MLRLAAPEADNDFAILSVAIVEFRSAVRRRQDAGDLEPNVATGLVELFHEHLETRFIRQPIVDFTVEAAADLVDRYRLRAYDAIQLSGCLTVAGSATGCIFACADSALLEAARAEGLLVLDPSTAETT